MNFIKRIILFFKADTIIGKFNDGDEILFGNRKGIIFHRIKHTRDYLISVVSDIDGKMSFMTANEDLLTIQKD